MNGSKVLITGGAGFVGSHIADQLIPEGVKEIVIIDDFVRGREENLEWAVKNGSVQVHKGDICDFELLNRLMDGADYVFHMAALRITQCAEIPRRAMEIMASAVFDVLECAVKHNVKKLVLASSASVYGQATDFPTTEDHHPYDNRTIYGACKTFNEGLCRSFNDMYGLDYVGLRYFNIYGPRMDIHGKYTEVLIRWMERIEAGLPPIIFGDGSQTMDFVYIDDVAKANILAAKSTVSDRVFNVASGTETSLMQLAEALLRIMGSDLKPEFQPERKVNPVGRRLADTRLAKQMLGFQASVGLEEGISRLVQWWRENRDRF